MKNKIIGILICILLLTNILPVSGIDDSGKINRVLNKNDTYYSSKVILFGIIKELQSGNMTSFTTVRVFSLTINNCNGTKNSKMNLSEKSIIDFHLQFL